MERISHEPTLPISEEEQEIILPLREELESLSTQELREVGEWIASRREEYVLSPELSEADRSTLLSKLLEVSCDVLEILFSREGLPPLPKDTVIAENRADFLNKLLVLAGKPPSPHDERIEPHSFEDIERLAQAARAHKHRPNP
jgi:hypothetical protein